MLSLPHSSSSVTAPAALVALLLAAPAVAQAQPGGDSRLEPTEIFIEKNRTNELPPASRNFEPLRIPPPPPVKKEIKYEYQDFRGPERPLPVTPRPAPLRQENAAPVPGVYVEAGFGNYGTPFGRLGAHTKPSTKFRAGLDARHQSSSSGPVDGKNSGGGNTAATAEVELFSKVAALGARAGFDRNSTYFYGYDQKAPNVAKTDALAQTHTRVNAEVFVRTLDAKRPFQAEVAAGVRSWQNAFDEKETDIYGKINLGFGFDEVNRFIVRTDVSSIAYESFAKQTRNFAQSTLGFEHNGARFDGLLGATVGYTDDTLNQAKQFNVYPAVRLSMEVIDNHLVLFGGATGGLERTSLYQLTRENPWLAGSRLETPAPTTATDKQALGLPVADVNRLLSVYGGLSGSPARAVRVLGRVSYNRFRNLYFYNPRGLDSLRYELTYAVHPDGRAAGRDATGANEEDQTVTNLNIHGELTVAVGRKMQLALKVDADTWKADSLRQAYHRPNLQATLTSTFAVTDKISVAPEVLFLGSAYGLGSLADTDANGLRRVRKTDTVVDINLRVDYQITPQFRIFALGQNLTAQKYQRFLNYPVRGLTAIAGLGYQF